jgi:hypothetical protein
MKKPELDASIQKSYGNGSLSENELLAQAKAGQEIPLEQLPEKNMKSQRIIYASFLLLLSLIMIICEVLRLCEIKQMIADNQTYSGRIITYGPILVSIMTFLIVLILLFIRHIKRVIIWMVVPLVVSMFHATYTDTFATKDVLMFFVAMSPGLLGIRNIIAIIVCFHVFRKTTIPIITYSLFIVYFVYGILSLLIKTNISIGIEYYTGYLREIAFTVILILISILISHEPQRKRRAIHNTDL